MEPRQVQEIGIVRELVPRRDYGSRTWQRFRAVRRLPTYLRILVAASVVLGILTGGNAAWGQATASLRGTVTDPSGSVVPTATVDLANPESRTQRTVVTGGQGEYQFLFLPPGTYTLIVTAAGFERYEQQSLELLVNTPVTANVQLKIGKPTESITVTGEAPALNMVDASLGNSYGETQVKQLPLEGRNIPDLLTLQAGVAYTGNRTDINKDQDTRSGAVNGARSDQTNVTLDGVDVNDQNSGYAFTSVLPVTLDSVQEFRVTTTNYNADQGEGSGAQVALVTKSGSNNFHGSLYEYNRNTATSANDWRVKTAEARTGEPNTPPKLIRNIFGASLGGPIKKDRLFFFTNYEGTRDREEHSVVRNIPTSSLCLGNIIYKDVNGGTTTLTSTAILNLDPWKRLGVNPSQAGINPAVLDLANHTRGYFDKTFCTPTGSKFPNNDPAVGDGLNYEGFRFRAPFSLNNDAFIARVDYHLTADGKHTLFWRGAVQNLFNPQEPFLPGSPPEQTVADHSKGFVVGYTAVLSSSKVNTFHWGFTRESQGFQGNTSQQWNTFYTLDQGISYSHDFQLPVHNLLDDFSWTKGNHTLQFGANLGFARDPRLSFQHSFATGLGATFWMAPVAFANTAGPGCPQGGSPLDPCYGRFLEPASTTAYDYPMLALLGMISVVRANYNYDKKGNLLNYTLDQNGNPLAPTGAPVKRNWGLDWYEYYGQDTWRLKPNLTITYGLRWSLFPPPWEINGFQASPTCSAAVALKNGTSPCPPGSFDLGKYFNQNAQNMKNGKGYADGPLISFELGGPANHGPNVAPGLYNFEKTDFSPRVSVAYSPRPPAGWRRKIFGESDKTVIRGGFGKVYDRTGMELLNTFDLTAPAGLSATLVNLCCGPGVDDASHVPRISDIHQIPVRNLNGSQFFLQPLLGGFPQTPGAFGNSITWGIDQSLKTPYAYALDFSIGRELPGGFSLQLSYVGRLGRNLLTQRDLTQPLDLVDPKSGIDYYKAATAFSKVARSQGLAATQLSATQFDALLRGTAVFWQHLLAPFGSTSPGLAPGATAFVMPVPSPLNPNTPDVAQAAYALYVTSGAFAGDEVVGLGNIDLFGALLDNATTPNTFFGSGTGNSYFFNGKTGEMLSQQLTSMYGWSSTGNSHYNALQANLRKRFSHGVQFDLNYTYSKSIDITSGAARLAFSGSDNIGAPGSRLPNAFSPNQFRAVSDFDTTHQFNADWIVELPFGKGRRFARDAGGPLDAFIGGWQVSGLARWTTGFPFSVDNGQFWPTNWDEQGSAQLVGKPKTGAFPQPNGTVSVFADPAGALANDFIHPFPGGSGSRNALRGQGYAGWDTSLSKRWKMPWESHSLQFRWEVFNVPNLHRFNVQAGLGDLAPSLQQVPGAFGSYTGLLTQPRVMQFALRYEF
jgi:Carboxypeptidase regulatory-like domain/TonB dependent receptor